jgi:ribose transport system substrate-binding protein
VEQVTHIFTDDDINPRFIEQLRLTRTAFTVCGESTATSFTPYDHDLTHYKIGFANLGEQMSFPVDVRRSLERAAKRAGNIDLLVTDNQLDSKAALQVADYLVAEGVDLAIEYQIDEKTGNLISDKFHRANIPVIAVDIPMVGATYFGVDNYRAGYLAGAALGNWLQENWGGCFDQLIVLEEQRAGALPAARIQGQLDGLQEIIGQVSPSQILFLDSGNTSEISESHMLAALRRLPNEHRLAVLSFNDDAVIGALTAARRLGREADVVIVGQGADRLVRQELRRPDSRIVGSTAYWPEKYGDRLIDVALKILRGEPVPPAVYNEHVFIARDNLDEYYPNSRDSSISELPGTAEEA